MTANAAVKNRLDWIDVAKGFTMLLVILGHCEIDQFRGVIFSFHMPLFFICSGFTMRFSQNGEQFVRKMRRTFLYLVTNALLIHIVRAIVTIINDPSKLSPPGSLQEYLSERAIVFIAGNGAAMQMGSVVIEPLGMPWFLLVLFFGRTIFDFLHLKCKKPVVFYLLTAALSIAGVCIGYLQWLPFSLDIALAIQPLFLSGFVLRKIEFKKRTLGICTASLAAWFVLLMIILKISGNYLDLSSRNYPVYPLCFLCGISGSLFVMCMSMLLSEHINKLIYPLKVLGKHSLIMLWIHCMDGYIPFIQRLFNMSANNYINAILRILIDCAVFALIMAVIGIYRRISKRTVLS